jgi:hypothetical protein
MAYILLVHFGMLVLLMADPDVWTHDCISHYEFALVFDDDIISLARNHSRFLIIFTTNTNIASNYLWYTQIPPQW